MRFRSFSFWISIFIHLGILGLAYLFFMKPPELAAVARHPRMEVNIVAAAPNPAPIATPLPIPEPQVSIEAQSPKPDNAMAPSTPAVPPAPTPAATASDPVPDQSSTSISPPPAPAPSPEQSSIPMPPPPASIPPRKRSSTDAASSSASTPPQSHLTPSVAKNKGHDTINASSDEGDIMDVKPDYLSNPSPIYPDLSRHERQEGTVMLEVIVNTEGNPERIFIQESSGFNLLDQAAVTSVRSWRFRPASFGTIRMKSRVIIPVHFHLENR